MTLTWQKTVAASYLAKVSTDLSDWETKVGGSLTAEDDENPEDAGHITVTFDLSRFPLQDEEHLFFRIEEE